MLRRMSSHVSTNSVAQNQRLAFWTDMVCDTYVQLDCEPPAGASSVEGDIVANQLATLHLSRVTASAQRVSRTPAKIARASEDYLLVSIQTQGQGVVSQDGRDAILAPGDFALYDSTRPYTLTFDGAFQQYVLMLPGPMLRTALRETERLTATTVHGDRGAGHLMIQMIQTLAADIDTLAPESATAVADSVAQILVAGLAALPQARKPPTTQLNAYYREQIKALVQQRLCDPELSVAAIAAQMRVSASTVHRAWGGESCSLSDWIWARRLDGAKRDLADLSLGARSVSDIAYRWGFSDAAHFSRSFKARFGCTPRELRLG